MDICRFWTDDFLVYFVHFVDVDFLKFDRYKRVQSDNIAWNALLLCLRLSRSTVATKQIFDRKFLHQILWHSLAKMCTKNCKKSIYVCKSYSGKISATFLRGHGVLMNGDILLQIGRWISIAKEWIFAVCQHWVEQSPLTLAKLWSCCHVLKSSDGDIM